MTRPVESRIHLRVTSLPVLDMILSFSKIYELNASDILDDYYEREKLKLDNTNDVDKLYKNFEKIHTGELLNSLGLNRYCCRRNLIANIDMMDVI